MKDKAETQKKLKLYRLLGAERFQKVVFSVEKIKYKVIKKIFPNIISWYEKQCDKNYLKLARKCSQEKSIDLLREYQKQKLELRKEMVYEKNRNYHYNPNYPTKFVKYLEINKKIHIASLKRNIVSLVGIGIFSLFFGTTFPIVCVLMSLYQIFGIFINFECINLQNYNLCRFQDSRMQTLLSKREERQVSKNLEQLSKGMQPVVKAMSGQIEIPTIDKVIANITTREEATQLLKYAKAQLEYLQNNNIENDKQKKIGGMRNG